jgi:2-(1,2-epoxy-1,2-dihydrophenyl)acetyl-CoA isomerase
MTVQITAADGVLRILLDDPKRKNALGVEDIRTIVEALEAASTDDSLRAVLLSSTGDDFCAGANWVATNAAGGERPRTGSIQRRTPVQAHRLVELLTEIQLPVICAVRGWAAGLGFQLALAADFTIATESARFWEPFLERGFSPDSGASWLLPRLVGLARAKELLLLGRELTGREAASWGLVYRAVPEEDFQPTVDDVVERLAGSATVALGLAKRLLHRGLGSSLADTMEHEANALELSSRTLDFKEGLAAFREGRDPRFEGR